jgi:thymidylate kinase
MIIIFDGTDLSGKTTAIELIAKSINEGFVLKNTYKPRKLEDSKKIYKQYNKILNLIKNTKDIVFLDRFFPSQAVYSFLRGKDEMFSKEIQEIEKKCIELDVLYIYITAPVNVLEERYLDRGDDYISFEKLKKIKSKYDLFYRNTNMKKIKVNTLEKDWLKKILKVIEYERK